MTDASNKWSEVGSHVSGLGQKLRYHFEQARSSETGSTGATDTARDERVHEAVRKLADALDGVFDAVGAAVKDPAVKDDVRQTGTALSEAIATTFADISDDLRRTFRRTQDDAPDAGTPSTPDTSGTPDAPA